MQGRAYNKVSIQAFRVQLLLAVMGTYSTTDAFNNKPKNINVLYGFLMNL